MGPQLVNCGCVRTPSTHDTPRLASMGPQLVSCGCMNDGENARICDPASMGPQLVSCGCRLTGSDRPARTRSFNGAAARELRMLGSSVTFRVAVALQWGRSS